MTGWIITHGSGNVYRVVAGALEEMLVSLRSEFGAEEFTVEAERLVGAGQELLPDDLYPDTIPPWWGD